MRSSVWSKGITKDKFSIFSLFPVLGTMIALLLGGALGIFGPYARMVVIGAIMLAVIIVLCLDELAATVVIAVHLYIDWYLGLRVVALLMVLALLVIFWARSPRHLWAEPRALWLWALLLMLAIFPAIRGALSLYDALFYYPNVFFGAFITYWLGIVIGRNTASVHRLFSMLAGFAALLAIHTIIEAATGTILFASSSLATHYGDALFYQYQLGESSVYRLGSFFIDPNWNGSFFAMMLFLRLGLFTESSSVPEKVLYLVETLLILLALLFTYSAGAWIASIAGLIAFTLFVGRTRYRIQIPLFMVVVGIMIAVLFASQVNYLLRHASDPNELLLRNAGWETAVRVILAFPLTGVGLGILGYAQRVGPYRAPAQYAPLSHPHNSYLELGAMAGFPVLLTFVALILFALWLALRNWALADVRARSLLAGGIAAVIVLSINSISINAWTLPPLAATGWLILGAISSPLLAKSRKSEMEQENSNNTPSHSS